VKFIQKTLSIQPKNANAIRW